MAVPKGYDDVSVVERLLFINSGAIHTTSNVRAFDHCRFHASGVDSDVTLNEQSLTHALYDLAAMPEYVGPLREEVEPIIALEGWSKNAITKMSKLDSFLKESTRIHGIILSTPGFLCLLLLRSPTVMLTSSPRYAITAASLTRKACKDVTLVDGTVIPKGTFVAAPQSATHLNEEYYPDASTFDPFRFSRAREEEGQALKHQFVNTSTEFIAFGHGKHAWCVASPCTLYFRNRCSKADTSCLDAGSPGRFFAVNELKVVVAYILLHYDLKPAGDGTRPKNVYLARNILPDPTGKVLFRKRKRKS